MAVKASMMKMMQKVRSCNLVHAVATNHEGALFQTMAFLPQARALGF